VARDALAHATARHRRDGISFASLDELPDQPRFDLCYSNGAFHHIPPDERHTVLARLRRWLVPGGLFALFENNPVNPGTRLIMSRVPFDKGAKPLRAGTARRLLLDAGFELVSPTRYLFVFPAALRSLRFLETRLEGLPLGGQYVVLARQPGGRVLPQGSGPRNP
jgi:SAM-dependent methyltransferase